MIQRIQTLYMFAVIVSVIVLFFITIAKYHKSDIGVTYKLFPNTEKIEVNEDGEPISLNQSDFVNSIWAIIANVIVGILVLVSIFMFKNRILQLRINAFAFLANLALIGIIFWQTDSIASKFGTNANYKLIGIFLPILNVIMLFLANKSIKKDERMIRAADRLR